ncbi:Hachiman antiphage defense system protein HamA [Blastopirellula marina]|uniref:Hachiman antiphage defense system protein HamA n=1 Tax=Blastopirellula marina TaxID=124 RepID=UPI000326AA0D|nr:Hachiman antiphage defense system protein HamA [Blastopirellula marina]
MANAPNSWFSQWFDEEECIIETVTVLNESENGRIAVFEQFVTVAVDHVIGLKVIESLGGFPQSTHVLKNRVPAGKIARSGFLGEILATEYVDEITEFNVPVRRLRHRDTRNLAMRGDDVLGFHVEEPNVKVIKVEAKSRDRLKTATISEARNGLANHEGLPNPETLAFLECHLRQQGRDEEADPITRLQKQSIHASNICHLVFTVSGNSPTSFLEGNSTAVCQDIELRLCGCRLRHHAEFVKSVFDACLQRGEADGVA